MNWEERFKDERETLSFLRQFFRTSHDRKKATGVLKARLDVENALDSNWKRVDRLTDVAGDIPEHDRMWTNIMTQQARIAISEWVSAGLAVETNVAEDDNEDKYAAEAAMVLLRNNWEEQGMDAKAVRIGRDLVTTGMAVVHIRYNPSAGIIKMLPVKDENGQPVMQPKTDMLGNVVVGPDNQPVMEPVMAEQPEGLVETDIIHPENYFPDHLATMSRYPRAVMILRHLPLQWAKDNFPDADINKYRNEEVNDIPHTDIGKEDMFLYGEYYEAGTPQNQEGVYIQFANFENILGVAPMAAVYKPIRIGELPFLTYYRRMPSDERNMGVWTTSDFYDLIDEAIVYQKILSRTADLTAKAMNPALLVPTMSGVEIENKDFTDGTTLNIIKYNPEHGSPVKDFAPNPQAIQAGMALMGQLKQNSYDITGFNPIDFGMKTNERTNVAIQSKKAISEEARKDIADYNERIDYRHAAMVLRLIKQHYDVETRIIPTLGKRHSNLVEYIFRHSSDPCDPKNVKIQRGSRVRESKADRQERLLTMMHQGAINPQEHPWILSEMDFPGGKEALDDIDLQKKAIDKRIDQILAAAPGAEKIQPLPGEDLNLTLKMMLKAIWAGRLEREGTETGRAMFMGILTEISETIAENNWEAVKQQIAIEQAKNFHVPVDPFQFDKQGNVEINKNQDVNPMTSYPKKKQE